MCGQELILAMCSTVRHYCLLRKMLLSSAKWLQVTQGFLAGIVCLQFSRTLDACA